MRTYVSPNISQSIKEKSLDIHVPPYIILSKSSIQRDPHLSQPQNQQGIYRKERASKRKRNMPSSNESIGQVEILQDHLNMVSSSSEHLCYAHCNFCDTVLAVSVPSNSLLKMVAVRCGHCTNLFSVNMRALLLPTSPPPPSNLLQHLNPTSFLSSPHKLMEEIGNNNPSLLVTNNHAAHIFNVEQPTMSNNQIVDHRYGILKSTPSNPPPEKKQRVASAYNRFIKEEIKRIKAGNPEISHREAFSAAAKNWAHFPHIHFGDRQSVMKADARYQQEEGHNVMMKEGFRASPANVNVGIAPYYFDMHDN